MNFNLEELNELIYNDNTNLELLEKRANLLFKESRFDEALRDFDIVLCNKDISIDSIKSLFYTYRNLEKNELALELWNKHKDVITNDELLEVKANLFMKFQEYISAHDCYREIIEEDEDFLGAYLNLLHCLLRLEDCEEAFNISLLVLEKSNNAPELFHDIAVEWISFDIDKALYFVNRGLEFSSEGFLYNAKGTILTEMNKYEEAILCCKKAIELDSENSYAYANLGNVYFKLKNIELGFEYYEKSLQINPSAKSYKVRAKYLQQNNMFDLSLDDLKNLYDMTSSSDVLIDISICLKELNNIECIDVISKVLESYSDSTYCLDLKLSFEIFFNRKDDALITATKLIEVTKGDEYSFKRRALVYDSLDDKQNALDDLVSSFEVSSEECDESLIVSIVSKYIYLNKIDDAFNFVNNVIELYKNNKVGIYCKSLIYKKLENYPLAILSLDEYLIENSDDIESLFQRAVCYYADKKYDEAISECNSLIKNYNYTFAYSLRADCFALQSNFKNTVRDLKLYLKEFDSNDNQIKVKLIKAMSFSNMYSSAVVKAREYLNDEFNEEVLIIKIDCHIKLGQYKKGLEEVNKMLEYKETVRCLIYKAFCYYMLERFDESIFEYTNIINLYDEERTYFFRAKNYNAIAKYDLALSDLFNELKIKETGEVYSEIANSYYYKKDYLKSLEYCKKAYELEFNDYNICNLAFAYLNVKDYDNALDIASIVESEVESFEWVDVLNIQISIEKEEYKKAVSLCELYFSSYDVDYIVVYFLGLALFMLNDKKCIVYLNDFISFKLKSKKAYDKQDYNEKKENALKMLKTFLD